MSSAAVGYQGVPGAFSEAAARGLVPGAEARGFQTFDLLIEAADTRAIDYALLPVENSIYGAIARSYDLLWSRPQLRIIDETVYRVVQALIGTVDAVIDDIVEIRSHPVALEQCRGLFARHPHWTTVAVDDTAGAVEEIVKGGDPRIAAVAGAQSAERYGAKVLLDGVQDDADNFTRFFLVQRDGMSRRQLGRACVALELEDRPGSLRDALSAFADVGLNLRSLVSRPSRTGPFLYRFYCEIEPVAAHSLEAALARIAGTSRILGFY